MSDLKKAQQLRAKKEMVRQKQQAAIEKRDMRANATRSENIARRKKAAEKVGKTFSYKDTVTPSVESGPLNYGSPMKKSSCIKMYDSKGKPAGLMAEGSMAHMEYMGSATQMSPYKMDHGSPAKETDPDPKKKKQKESTLSDKDKYIDRKLNELAKTKPDMPPLERLKYAKNSYEMLPKKTK